MNTDNKDALNNRGSRIGHILVFVGGFLLLVAMYSLWFGGTTFTWLLIYNGLALISVGRFFYSARFGKIVSRTLEIIKKDRTDIKKNVKE